LFAELASVRGDLREPDSGFDSLYLTKERSDTVELVVAPMLKQARRLRRHTPIPGIREVSPFRYLLANLVYNADVVFLFLVREPVTFVENQCSLFRSLPLFRLRNGGNEPHGPPF